jgi:hypothetical protein
MAGIPYSPGIHRWSVTTDDLVPLQPSCLNNDQYRKLCTAGMWPPSITRPTEPQPPLERCVRLFPQNGNGGGFFVSLLRKVAPLRHSSSAKPTTLVNRSRHAYVGASPAVLKSIAKWFGLDRKAFVQNRLLDHGVLVARAAGSANVVLLSNELHRHLECTALVNVVWGGVQITEKDRRSKQIRATQVCSSKV